MLWTGSFPERHHIASNPESNTSNPEASQSGVREAAKGLQMTVPERHLPVWVKSI
jgi:hypothetical protein